MQNKANYTQISQHVGVYHNGMNMVVVSKNGRALAVHCPLYTMLDSGVKPDIVVCLNYRSSINGGVTRLPGGHTVVMAPASFKDYFTFPHHYFLDRKNILHNYSQHPDYDMPAKPVRADIWLNNGDCVDFEGIRLSFMEVKGDTVGELACLIHDDIDVGVCCDLICGDGQVPFLYQMSGGSKGWPLDYHSFLRAKDGWADTLGRLTGCAALVPSRGGVISDPAAAAAKARERLERLYNNYASVSAIHFYFGDILPKETKLFTAELGRFPDNITRHATTVIIRSANKRGFIIDCGQIRGMNETAKMIEDGLITGIDGCFITHYHDDHADFLTEFSQKYNCPVWACESVAMAIRRPEAYNLPCGCETFTDVQIWPDGERREWEGYTLRAFEFPGQSLHHDALLFDDGGTRVLFGGDSFSPTGFDDYCPPNRNFVTGGRGFFKCLDLVEKYRPDWIANQHQSQPFHFTGEQLRTLRDTLARRAEILAGISPWASADHALDPYWVRLYPYVSGGKAGAAHKLALQATGHTARRSEITVKIEISAGTVKQDAFTVTLPPYTDGYNTSPGRPDPSVEFEVELPGHADTGVVFAAAHVWMDGEYLGEMSRAAIKLI